MTAEAPFRQGRFADLPATPRVPHPFFAAPREDVVLRAGPLAGTRIAVRTWGQGPPLLLVHGLMTGGYSFRHVLAPLGARRTLYVPDLPGAGDSDAPAARLTPEVLGDAILGVAEALGVAGAPVLGNSMGGYVAMHLALRRPSAMAALVNVHSPGFPELRLHALRGALALPGARWLLHALVARDPRRWVHRNVHYRDESLKSLEEADVYGAPLRTVAGRDAFRSYLRDTMDPFAMKRFQAELGARRAEGLGFPIPLLLLWARRDPMVPPSFGPRFAAAIPDAELRWLEDASHFAHVDQPAATADAVLEFLDRQGV